MENEEYQSALAAARGLLQELEREYRARAAPIVQLILDLESTRPPPTRKYRYDTGEWEEL